MLLTSRFSQAMCGVVISRDGDAERHSRRPVRAHLEYIVTAVKSEDVRDLEAHPEKLKDYVASLDRRADVQRSNYPLGVVATDHAGYCSFDLEPFQVAIHAASLPAREGFDALKFIRNFWIEPLGAAPVNIFDLENLQVTPEGLLAYLSLP